MSEAKVPRRISLICVLLSAVTLLVYCPAFHFEFIDLDDSDYITRNPSVQTGLTWTNIRWAGTTSHCANWHPVTWLSHMLDAELFGMNAGGHHLVNVVLHIANTILLFLLLLRLTRAVWSAGTVAALFALHPQHVESVAWVAERKDLLSALFFFLTLHAYSRYAETKDANGPPKRRWLWYALALISYAFGLMSKPMLVTLPFVLLLLDWWPLRRLHRLVGSAPRNFPLLFLEKVPFLLLCFASCLVTLGSQGNAGSVVSTDVLPIADRVTNAVASYAKYLGRTFWPVELTVLYPHPSLSFGASFRWSSGQIALGSALLALISVIALISSRRQPWVIVGWLWFVGMLVPVIGLVQVGEQAMADRYTYLPLTGVFIAIVWTAREWLGSERWGRKALTILGIAAITAASILTREQLAYWKNDIALFSHALEINPRNPAAQFGLAQGLVKVGDEAEAIALLQAAIQELPHSTEIHQTLGIAFLKLGRWVEAAHEFRTVLSISPGHANALDGLTTVSIRHGGELLKSGRTNDAAGFLSASLTVQSDFVQRCLSSSRTLARSGSFEGAIDRARLATWLAPGNADAHELLGILLAQNGQVDESITEFRSAIRLNPDQLFALNNLAWILSTSADPGLRNGPEAITLARRACDLTGFKQPVFLGTLSTALAEAGHFSEAIKTAETARDLAMALGNQKLVQMGERLIELYQTNTPFRELRAPSNKSTSVQRP